MPQAGVRTYETPSHSSNSDWADKVKIAVLRDIMHHDMLRADTLLLVPIIIGIHNVVVPEA
jgi:hypothetical protein